MKNKLLALKLLKQKIHDPSLTFPLISEKTGYSKRQLIRLSHSLDGSTDMEALCHHSNEGKEPVNKALESEIQFLIDLKKPYPSITISQFRDIFFEDVLNDPAKSDVVARYQLRPRSLSWFRSLFIQQGWKSPVSRKPLRRDGRAPHPLREPAPQRGMLIQIDGTPFDWIGNGEMWTLHLAVDDATTEPLAGCFMPTERQLGYCYIMYDILTKYGIPMSLYSDKHTIFRSSKEGNLTQFGQMMADLGIEMIFANSPQAKGRIERYNGTVQRRLPNDIIRFGIHDYDTLNRWFTAFYLPYIRRKFAFLPKDPHGAFVPLDGYDIDSIFTLRYERRIKNDSFSINGIYYSLIDENGEIMHILNDTPVSIRVNVFTNQMYALRYRKKYPVIVTRDRRTRPSSIADNQKDLHEILNNFAAKK